MRTPKMWIALSLASILALAGCSAGDAGRASDSAGDMGNGGSEEVQAPAEAPAEAPADAGSDTASDAEGGGDLAPADLGDAAGSDDESDANLAAAGRSVITVGTVSVTVEDPFEVAQNIIRDVSEAGGWVEGRSYRGATETEGASATLVLRLPPGEVSAAIESLGTYGAVDSLDQSREDVTTQVRDLEARIYAMELSVARVAQFLEQATNRAELLEAEQLLTDRQAQLETLLAQQRALGAQVSASTLTVQLWTPESAPPPPEPDPEPTTGFFSGLQNGWNAFYDFGSDALLVIGALLPWLVFAAIIAIAFLAIARPIRRRQAAKRPSAASAGPAGPMTALPPQGAPGPYPGQPSAPYGYPAQPSQPWPAPQPPVAPPVAGPPTAEPPAPPEAPQPNPGGRGRPRS